MPIGSINNNPGNYGYDTNYDTSSGGAEGSDPSLGGGGQQNLFQEIEQLVPAIMQLLQELEGGGMGQGSAGMDPGDGSADPGYGSTDPGYGASGAGDGSMDTGTGQYGSTGTGAGQVDSGSGSSDPTSTGSTQSASSTGSTSSSSQSSPLTGSYNNVMNLISADGTDKQSIVNAINQFEAQAGSQMPNVQNVMNNIKNSINDGTYSQQGSQGALEGAAQQDGVQGANSPLIDGSGAEGMVNQGVGMYDSGSSVTNSSYKNSSVGANTNILQSEIQGGAPSSQIKNNALALAKEAQAAGMTNLANAAENIAKSIDDGSYDAQKSTSALGSATNTENMKTES